MTYLMQYSERCKLKIAVFLETKPRDMIQTIVDSDK
jgi:hypothetical protein